MKSSGLKTRLIVLVLIFMAGSLTRCATGKWDFIDKDEKIVFQQQFDEATPFGDGLAGVKVGNKWGFIDINGNMIDRTAI